MSKKSNKLLRTPSSQESGVKAKRLQTKNGETARIGERAYDKETGRLAQVGLEQQINFYSQEASPVSPSPMQDESVARQMTVTSGRRLSQSLKLSNPIGLFLKTCLESSIWYSPIVKLEWQAKALYSVLRMTKSAIIAQSAEESSETYDKQGMKQYGLLFQLVASAHPTEEIEFGLLPTLTKQDSRIGTENMGGQQHRSERGSIALADVIQFQKISLLPTLTGQETEHPQMELTEKGRRATKDKSNSHSLGIADRIAMLPKMLKTPSSVETEGGIMEIRPGTNAHYKLRDQIAMLPTPTMRDYKGANSEEHMNRDTGHANHMNQLPNVIRMIPTPKQRDWQGPSQRGKYQADAVPNIIQYQDGKKTGMKLQPEFALWMMGYPMDWLDLKDGE